MAADGISKGVNQFSTKELIDYLGDDEKFIRSEDEPQPGDIFLWRDGGRGHTGIVEKVGADGTVHTIEAYGTDEGTIRFKRNLSSFTGKKGWQGFFRPAIETEDGKFDDKKADQSKNNKNDSKIRVSATDGETTKSSTINTNNINSWTEFKRELLRWLNW